MPLRPVATWLRSRRAGLAGLGLATALAALSLAQGIRNALERSQDFQWSGTRMLLNRIDPWADALRGDPLHLVHLSQIPNYLSILYVLLVPLGLLPLAPAELVWALLNGAFAILSAWIAARFCGLPGRGRWLVICLLLMSTPARETIGNGQQGLLVLVLWTVSLLALRVMDAQATVAGISYFKFNFGPPLFLYLLLRRGVRAAAWSLVPLIAATLLVWGWLPGPHTMHGLTTVFVEPIVVAQTGYFPSGGDPNLMDVLQATLFHHYAPGSFLPAIMLPTWLNLLTLACALGVCAGVLYFAVRRTRGSSVEWQMALLGTASFGLFKHHSYDAVVLLFPLCYALRLWRHALAWVAIGAVAYVWYLQRVLEMMRLMWRFLFFAEFGVLMVLLFATYRLGRLEFALDRGPR